MFNGMMDPELMRIAQEQMRRMSPTELARIQQQMMSNPELMRMASESMKNMRPEDLRHASEQLKRTYPEDMAEIGEKMANATPEEIEAMRAHMDAQITYEINAAQLLKKQGNELHSQGKYNDALQKYLLAKTNLQNVISSKGRSILLACSLNIMSCYLKTRQFDECIQEGNEVLEKDSSNVKALYRRGQAYKELGQLENAVSDLSKAHEVTPDDETITDVLRDSRDRLMKEGGGHVPRGLVIEEITKEDLAASSKNCKASSPMEYPVSQPLETSGSSVSQIDRGVPPTNSDRLLDLKDDPESIRSFQNFVSRTDPETLTAISGGNTGGITPEMVKLASNLVSKMPPEEFQRMLKLATSSQGGNPYLGGGSSNSTCNSFVSESVPPKMTPEMLKAATDVMGKMSTKELQKMFEMESSLKGKDSVSAAASVNSNGLTSDGVSRTRGPQDYSMDNVDHVGQSSPQEILSSRSAPQSSFPSSSSDLQEQMRNQMKDPAMRQMFSSMIKNMSPDMMANMSEQFGFKISPEDAAKAQQAMSSLSPDDLDRMMRWMDRLKKGVEGARKTKKWLLGRPGMILAILMVILAVLLHWVGYIGR